jgi:hypothetical protein
MKNGRPHQRSVGESTVGKAIAMAKMRNKRTYNKHTTTDNGGREGDRQSDGQKKLLAKFRRQLDLKQDVMGIKTQPFNLFFMTLHPRRS